MLSGFFGSNFLKKGGVFALITSKDIHLQGCQPAKHLFSALHLKRKNKNKLPGGPQAQGITSCGVKEKPSSGPETVSF